MLLNSSASSAMVDRCAVMGECLERLSSAFLSLLDFPTVDFA